MVKQKKLTNNYPLADWIHEYLSSSSLGGMVHAAKYFLWNNLDSVGFDGGASDGRLERPTHLSIEESLLFLSTGNLSVRRIVPRFPRVIVDFEL